MCRNEPCCAFEPDDDDDDDDDIDPYLGREHEYPIDENYCWLLSFIIENDRPIAVWERFTRQDELLAPGRYLCRVKRWNIETGEPERVALEGTSKSGAYVYDAYVDWAVLATEIELGHIAIDKEKERTPFDPRPYSPKARQSPVATKNVAQVSANTVTATGGLLGAMRKLFGR